MRGIEGAIWTSRARMLRFEGRRAEALATSAEGVRRYRAILPDAHLLEILEAFVLSLVDTGRVDAGLLLLAFCEDRHRLRRAGCPHPLTAEGSIPLLRLVQRIK